MSIRLVSQMVRVVIKELPAPPDTTPDTVRLYTATVDGKDVQIAAANASNPSFGQDLHFIFKRNVKNARIENERLLGAADGIIKDR
ncbi:MAG: hypothetical protein SFV21_06940 [Rhodospirillaceae bacterium]|nr:hypothetical protein [Rhodospirillaceae bacterium]